MQTASVTTLEAADKHLSLIPNTKVHNGKIFMKWHVNLRSHLELNMRIE